MLNYVKTNPNLCRFHQKCINIVKSQNIPLQPTCSKEKSIFLREIFLENREPNEICSLYDAPGENIVFQNMNSRHFNPSLLTVCITLYISAFCGGDKFNYHIYTHICLKEGITNKNYF